MSPASTSSPSSGPAQPRVHGSSVPGSVPRKMVDPVSTRARQGVPSKSQSLYSPRAWPSWSSHSCSSRWDRLVFLRCFSMSPCVSLTTAGALGSEAPALGNGVQHAWFLHICNTLGIPCPCDSTLGTGELLPLPPPLPLSLHSAQPDVHGASSWRNAGCPPDARPRPGLLLESWVH